MSRRGRPRRARSTRRPSSSPTPIRAFRCTTTTTAGTPRPSTSAARVLQRLQRLRRHRARCRRTSSCGARARCASRPKCCSRRSSSAFRRRSHRDQPIHVATAARCARRRVTVQQPMNAWHFTASQRARHGLRRRAITTSGTPGASWSTMPRTVARACRPRTTTPRPTIVTWFATRAHALDWLSHEWPGVPVSVREDDGRAGARRDGVPDDGERRELSRHDRSRGSSPSTRSRTPISRSTWGSTRPATGSWTKGWATTLEYLINGGKMGRSEGGGDLPAVPRAGLAERSAHRAGRPDHHAQRHRQQRLREARAGLPRPQGPARRLASSAGAARVHRSLARKASAPLGLLQHLQRRDRPRTSTGSGSAGTSATTTSTLRSSA